MKAAHERHSERVHVGATANAWAYGCVCVWVSISFLWA